MESTTGNTITYGTIKAIINKLNTYTACRDANERNSKTWQKYVDRIDGIMQCLLAMGFDPQYDEAKGEWTCIVPLIGY